MTQARISQVLVWILAALTLALFGLFVALLGGAISVADPPALPGSEALVSSATEPTDEPPQGTATKRVLRATPTPAATRTTTSTPIRSQIATVIVTAARGDCWISARLGSENGPVLEERLLAQGESVTLRGARVWMSIGASGNVDDCERRGARATVRHGSRRPRPNIGQVGATLNGDGDR
jgi:hypothetical protein